MSNVVIIFAGGTGQRMHSGSMPKQFLELNGKPIIIYTVEQFERSADIDGIVIVCLEQWLSHCQEVINRFEIKKVVSIVPGGKTGFESRLIGVREASKFFALDSVALMHDGVRPLIDQKTISDCISSVRCFGSAITTSPAQETIAVKTNDGSIGDILDRSQCEIAKAPQCFLLGDMLKVHNQAYADGIDDCIDTAFLMRKYGYELHSVVGRTDNIKITTPLDYYVFKAIIEANESKELFEQ